MLRPVVKRQKVLPPVGTSVVLVGGSCLSLIGHFMSFEEFLCWRRTCTSIWNCTRERFLRWERYNGILRDDEILQLRCNDMYGFICSKIDCPDYLEDRPDQLPKWVFPSSAQLARASMSSLDPEVLLRLPLRLLNAMGGIDALSRLPNGPLLPRHFTFVRVPLLANGPHLARRFRCKALSFRSDDVASPIVLFYDEVLTVIVFRSFLSNHYDARPIVTHWYTCQRAFDWWCEFPHSSTDEIHYDVVFDADLSATRYAVQIGQTPPSPLSFFRPYNYGPWPYMFAHSTVWVAMEYLKTLVSARSVSHISITHQEETFVRLAEFHPPMGNAVFLALLDWARTQIRQPLLFRTMPPSWSAYNALESCLAAANCTKGVGNEWVLHRVPMDEYSELCDDERFPLSEAEVMKRLPILMDNFFCPIMLALHSLFSKGNRGLRPRITAHAVTMLQRAADILRHRLLQSNGLPQIPLNRRHIPELLQLFKDVSSEESSEFMPPTHEVIGFRTHEVLLFESCRLDSSFFHPDFIGDDFFDAHGEVSPEFMCNICSCTHWGNPNRVIHSLASTHATRERILRAQNYHTPSLYSPTRATYCLLDPAFPEELASRMHFSAVTKRSVILEVSVPAYHVGNANRRALLNTLAGTWSLTNAELDEFYAGRYYLHTVSLMFEPEMNVCFLCDINYANTDYKYISLDHSP
jgi:hypothetical protein